MTDILHQLTRQPMLNYGILHQSTPRDRSRIEANLHRSNQATVVELTSFYINLCDRHRTPTPFLHRLLQHRSIIDVE
ncbi:hypothetical protein JHK86_012671 [Glycine max]|nr:hypothetical protein JHK86_012671 [Glycine max]